MFTFHRPCTCLRPTALFEWSALPPQRKATVLWCLPADFFDGKQSSLGWPKCMVERPYWITADVHEMTKFMQVFLCSRRYRIAMRSTESVGEVYFRQCAWPDSIFAKNEQVAWECRLSAELDTAYMHRTTLVRCKLDGPHDELTVCARSTCACADFATSRRNVERV
jgi:hypothetical protein